MKKKTKQMICLALACLLMFLFSGCGEYSSASNPGGNETEPSNGGEVNADDPTVFTVSLRYNGSAYIPRAKDDVKAQWTDGFTVYTADFGTDGVARVAGLDGDYSITLYNLPDGYLYNPNAYMASNTDRNVVIDLYKPIRTSGYGTGPYDSIKISKLGVYRVELKSAEHKVFFEYAPLEGGTYTVESWVSTAEGTYNPKCDVYNGSIAYKLFAYTLNDGGISEGYTQNFKHTVEVADEQIGDSGQAVFTFAVHCDSKNDIYPVYVDFALQLNGSFELDHMNKVLIIPTEEFTEGGTPDHGGEYTFTWAESTDKFGAQNRPIFDGDSYKLWAKEDGGDGYYHCYDEVKYADGYTEYFADGTSKTYPAGYGPLLYAKISEAHRFTEAPFTAIEAAGNSSLTVNGWENHKIFIEGIEGKLHDPTATDPQATSGSYFCLGNCPCRTDQDCIGACGESCTKCLEGCRNLPDEWLDQIILAHGDDGGVPDGYVRMYDGFGNHIYVPYALCGYQQFCDSNGCYPVTEELQYFLQSFSVSQRYFADGEGWVETHDTYKVDAKEADQWLFACGYYVKS